MLFKLRTDGLGFQVIYAFTTLPAFTPLSLIQGRDGWLYGGGVGGVFKLNPATTNVVILRMFNSVTDGVRAVGRLVHGSDGALYGTCRQGGPSNQGTIFRMNTDGSGFTVLRAFTGDNNGGTPQAGVTEASNGALYGATLNGGLYGGGTLYKINRDGSGFQVLWNFDPVTTTPPVGPQNPLGDLVEGPNGRLYGTSLQGGTNDLGTIYSIKLDGSQFEVLYHFWGSTDTNVVWVTRPNAGLTLGTGSQGSGVLYGNTRDGSPGSGIYAIVVNAPVSITPLAGDQGGGPVVFWPAWALGYQLQTTTNPVSGPWMPATNGTMLSGFQPAMGSTQAYFRLVWPPQQ